MNIHERDDKFSALWGVSPSLGFKLVKFGLKAKSHFHHSLVSTAKTEDQEYLQIPAWTLGELVEESRGIDGIEIDWSVVMESAKPVDSLAELMLSRIVALNKYSEDEPKVTPDDEELKEENKECDKKE